MVPKVLAFRDISYIAEFMTANSSSAESGIQMEQRLLQLFDAFQSLVSYY